MKSTTCLWCGRTIEQPDGPGRPPLYCSASHRQRAHQLSKQQKAVTSALTKQMRHVQNVFAGVGGSGKLSEMVAEASRAQEVFAGVGGSGKLSEMVAEASRAQEVFAVSVGGSGKLSEMVAEASRAQEAFAVSVGGSGKLSEMVAEASRAQEAFAASVADPIRHLQSIFADGAVEASKALDALTSQITQVASVPQGFAAKVNELSKAQAGLASMVADSAVLGNLQLNRGFPKAEEFQSLAMSASLVGLAGIAATRIEAAGFTDQFASALEGVASTLSRADVETTPETRGPSSEELFTDHGELERLICPGLDVVATLVLLTVLVGASLPFIADAVITIFLVVLGECWATLRLVNEVAHLDPAISGLLTLLTVFGVVGRRG